MMSVLPHFGGDTPVFLLGIYQRLEFLPHGVVIFGKYTKQFFKVVENNRFLLLCDES